MVLVIDNYDSFTYNLVQYLGEMGCLLKIVRNDQVSISDIRRMNPERIVISPGPCTPADAGVILEVVRELHKEYPILGVCLGHQTICTAFGGEVVLARHLMHGKTSQIRHNGKGIFTGIPTPFTATRYHSLVALRESLPDELEITASSLDDGYVMGVRHTRYPIDGVQFHPESVLSPEGDRIIRNFLYPQGILA